MVTKKVYKLKTWPKIVIALLIILGISSFIGMKFYQKYQYKQTNEYIFLNLGYTEEETQLFLTNLNIEEQKKIINHEYNEFIPKFVNAQYFIFSNLEEYLSQVITQSDDFFKYHGTDGYDYNKIVSVINVKANQPAYEDIIATDISDEYAMLVNKYHQLSDDYEPDNLVEIPWTYRLGGESDKKYIKSEVYDAFIRMWDAAKESGIYLVVETGYRSYSSQESIYKIYKELNGVKFADEKAARAGHSEHQTGLALNIYSKECAEESKFADSKTYEWLINNSYKYGFILRYPNKKDDITGFPFEASHFRYLGSDLALKVYESKLTYDEYYAYYIENKENA